MSESRLGRVVGGRIDLHEPDSELEGKFVRVTLEVVPENEGPFISKEGAVISREDMERRLDAGEWVLGPASDEDRAEIEKSRNEPFISHEEMRRRLAAHHAKLRTPTCTF